MGEIFNIVTLQRAIAKLACCSFLLLLSHAVSSQSIPQKAFWVCGDSRVLLVDYNASINDSPAIIWQWDSKTAADIPEDFRSKFNTLDDSKTFGNEVLISASSGAVAIVGIKDKKVHFYAEAPLAHSVEMLPGGLLAVAASTHVKGNRIFLFDVKKGNTAVYADSLYSAHGVVWDDHRKSLFAIGYSVLREYKLNPDKSGLIQINEWKIPGKGGHDLQMAPDKSHLFFTSETGNGEFDLDQHRFIGTTGFVDTPNVKSIGQDSTGQFIYTIPEESWWTFHVKFSNPERTFSFPDLKVYKARWY